MKYSTRTILTVLLLWIFQERAGAQIIGIKISGDTCSNFTLDLQALGTSNSPYFFWHFGDPASGTNDSITITGLSPVAFPTHTFSGPGIYNVCVSFQEPSFPVTTICRTISIGLCCDGIISTTDSCVENSIPFSMLTGATINNISWNFGDAASGAANTSNLANPGHTFTAAGTYTVTAVVNATCGTFSDTSVVNLIACTPPPCTGSILYNDTCLDAAASFQLSSAKAINSVNWNFDDPASGASNTATGIQTNHVFSSAKVYTVSAIVNFECGTDTIYQNIRIVNCTNIEPANCKLIIPNAFSPNDDQLNDYFNITSSCAFEKYELFIFNRWGQQVFKSDNPANIWDGKLKSVPCPVGVYAYLLKLKYPGRAAEIRKGDLTLLK
jgi:gliding motility-associated-like protein